MIKKTPLILVLLSKYQYADKKKGESHEYTEIYKAICRSFKKVVFVDTSNHIKTRSLNLLNRKIIQLYIKKKFSHVFCVQWGNEFYPETLSLMKNSGSILINWATDDSYRFESFTKYIADRFSLNVTTELGAVSNYKKLGLPCFKGHWGFNKKWDYKPKPSNLCKYDISFVGINYFDRMLYVNKLLDNGLKVNVFGHGWKDLGNVVESNEIPKIYNNSKITLNFSKSKYGNQTKARVFEAIASGSCLLTEDSPDLEHYFDKKKHLVTFKNKEECLKKALNLISSTKLRDTIAMAGYKRCIMNYSYDEQILKIFNSVPIYNEIIINKDDINHYWREINNNFEKSKIIKKIINNKVLPSIFFRIVRKVEYTFFKNNYLSKNSFTIGD